MRVLGSEVCREAVSARLGGRGKAIIFMWPVRLLGNSLPSYHPPDSSHPLEYLPSPDSGALIFPHSPLRPQLLRP